MSADEKVALEAHDFEYLKLSREALAKEIDYRRETRWRIFSWTSSVSLAALGGMIALTSRGFTFPMLPHRAISAVAILSVSLYAFTWITLNKRHEDKLKVALKEYDSKLGINSMDKSMPLPIGYRASMLITAVLTIAVILFVGG